MHPLEPQGLELVCTIHTASEYSKIKFSIVIGHNYWLVRGVGKAVHVISDGATTVPPANFTTAKIVLRVFAASNITDGPSLRPVAALRIRARPQMAILDWLSETNRSGYRVESRDSLGTTNWQVLAEPSGTSWSNALPPTAQQRFYRVFSKP